MPIEDDIAKARLAKYGVIRSFDFPAFTEKFRKHIEACLKTRPELTIKPERLALETFFLQTFTDMTQEDNMELLAAFVKKIRDKRLELIKKFGFSTSSF